MLKEHGGGVPAAEICRTDGLSPATFYKFKSKYGGMDASDAHKLKSLEQENDRLKRLLADAMLDNVALKCLCLNCQGSAGRWTLFQTAFRAVAASHLGCE
jgi:putative transposase